MWTNDGAARRSRSAAGRRSAPSGSPPSGSSPGSVRPPKPALCRRNRPW
ncbi:hypothetical protein C791_3560 [Amycolatopsis azurea DSM 43854]|uniref:Uncharacterized protein n=1 Tax=Amycolatopsis azurea DSM 43854 TaxID=1238180 RepID=M2QID6_9PSEU|nr:hypothetical protein C791_3560 [Amycolatopsis azurea DSM 43854]